MKQKVCSVEQMRYLTDELGVDTSDASMVYYELNDKKSYVLTTKSNFGMEFNREVGKNLGIHFYYTYTLEDILEKLPQRIKVGNGNSLKDRAFFEMNKMAKSGYHMAYEQSWDNGHGTPIQIKMHGEQMHGSALQCAYGLFIWCIKNGHIDLHNTEEGE